MKNGNGRTDFRSGQIQALPSGLADRPSERFAVSLIRLPFSVKTSGGRYIRHFQTACRKTALTAMPCPYHTDAAARSKPQPNRKPPHTTCQYKETEPCRFVLKSSP
ncbi:hypothetical protein [Neisseria sp.]|uniref:hypothetical protein n=1 Tax=Neisseria sp. TaxID=192066 RepID=UPI0035A0B24A